MNVRAVACALALLAAGCLAPAATPPAPDRSGTAPLDPIPEDEGHDHGDPAQHAFATPNVELLAFHALGDDPRTPIGHYGEIDTWSDGNRTLAVVAVTGIDGEPPGFVVVDVTDPRAPQRLSWTESPLTGRLADVKWHPSGRWIFAAAQSGTAPKPPGPALAEPGAAEFYATQNGLRLYDASDPAAPALVQQEPSRSGYGCHMVYHAAIGGAEWLFCIGRTVEVWSFAGGRMEWRSHYVPQGTTGVENVLANDRSNPQGFVTETRLSVTPHDATFQLDPIDGRPLLLVSWWDLGVRIVDVSDPAMPREVGAWAGEGAERFEGNVHTAMLAKVGDRRLLYATPELLSDNAPAFWVLDATDLARPTYVAEWTAPGEHGAAGIRLSTHNFQVVGERVVLAYYHAGVWILDLAVPESPQVVGYYLPHEDVPATAAREAVWTPNVWDVVVQGGVILASDSHQGLFLLHEASDLLGPGGPTSFA